jgi:hypothetical protein
MLLLVYPATKLSMARILKACPREKIFVALFILCVQALPAIEIDLLDSHEMSGTPELSTTG